MVKKREQNKRPVITPKLIGLKIGGFEHFNVANSDSVKSAIQSIQRKFSYARKYTTHINRDSNQIEVTRER